MCARRRTSLTLMSLSSSGAERRSKPSSMLFIARRAFTRTCLASCLTRLTFVSSENTIAAIFTRTNIMHAMAIPSEPSDPFTNYIFESRGLPSVANGVPSQRVDDYFSFALANGGYSMHTSSVLFRREQLNRLRLVRRWQVNGRRYRHSRLAFRGSFQYVARLSATYRDALDSSAVARNVRREAPFPVFAGRLPDMISAGEVPARLVPSARRYANFLLLEHARLLLDRGEHSRAREVLLLQCTLAWDSKRYLKRLLRTSLLGQWGFNSPGKCVPASEGALEHLDAGRARSAHPAGGNRGLAALTDWSSSTGLVSEPLGVSCLSEGLLMPPQIVPVIMCGGAGTRLWPVSRESMPKQFVPLVGQGSTFQQVLARLSHPEVFTRPTVIT